MPHFLHLCDWSSCCYLGKCFYDMMLVQCTDKENFRFKFWFLTIYITCKSILNWVYENCPQWMHFLITKHCVFNKWPTFSMSMSQFNIFPHSGLFCLTCVNVVRKIDRQSNFEMASMSLFNIWQKDNVTLKINR